MDGLTSPASLLSGSLLCSLRACAFNLRFSAFGHFPAVSGGVNLLPLVRQGQNGSPRCFLNKRRSHFPTHVVISALFCFVFQ